MPISQIHTLTHSNTRRETRTQTEQRIQFFTAPMYSGGWAGGVGKCVLVCLCISCISFGADRTEHTRYEESDVVVLPRATQSTQWVQSVLEKSSQPPRASARLTDFSTTDQKAESQAHMEPILCLSEWAQRESGRSGSGKPQREKAKLSPRAKEQFSRREICPNHMFCILCEKYSKPTQIPSPPKPQLELPDFLRFVYS